MDNRLLLPSASVRQHVRTITLGVNVPLNGLLVSLKHGSVTPLK